MKRGLRLAAVGVCASLLSWGGRVRADAGADLDAALDAAVDQASLAAAGVLEDDRAVVNAGLEGAQQATAAALEALTDPALRQSLGAAARRLDRKVSRVVSASVKALFAAFDPDGSAFQVARRVESLVRATRAARESVAPAEGPAVHLGRSAGIVRNGDGMIFLLSQDEEATFQVAEDGPAAALGGEIEDLGGGRYRIVAGPGPGSARVLVLTAAGSREFRVLNRGAKGALSKEPGWGESGSAPTSVTFPVSSVSWRSGVPVAAPEATVFGAAPARFKWTVDPPLPTGVSIDPETGEISGTPSGEQFATVHVITVSNVHGSAEATLSVEVTPPLPAGVEWLADGFAVDPFLEDLSVPVKMALAPDGRLFFNELSTGNIRVVGADGILRPTPFATVAVQAGAERGLLGIALAPDFAVSGDLYVYATVPAADPLPVRGQVIRFTASGDVGGSPAVILDGLPAGLVQNGGDLQFGPDGRLYLSIGDTGDSSLAQADGERAGRILRYAPDGSIPADNPIPDDPEWARGLRNSFDMAFHGPTGSLFASENGPTFGDELNFIQRGKNFGWEALPPDFPGSQVGRRLVSWTPVIVPTGIAFHDGTGFGAEYEDALFLAAYDDAEVSRLLLSGSGLADFDAQFPFARFDDSGGVDQKPLDLVVAPDGDLLVSTFASIWRIERYATRAP